MRAVVWLILTLLCGSAAAQEASWLRSVLGGSGNRNAAIADNTPAQDLFGSVASPAPLSAQSIGSYSRGCLAGGEALPINGRGWQVMRLSRNRNWGHPLLVAYLERLARDARSIGWPGLLVGDLSQPRGGPMLTGHASHQIGLDADIWLTPMPSRVLTPQEREEMSAISMLRDPLNVDRARWTPMHTQLIKLASSYPEVERIFVHPAIKQMLCDQAGGDRLWLAKVRPWWGHYYHFHIRLGCPRGAGSCRGQAPVTADDGCGAELDNWFTRLNQAELQPAKPDDEQKPTLRLADLPPQCRAVLTAGGAEFKRRMVSDKPAGPPPPRFHFQSPSSFGN